MTVMFASTIKYNLENLRKPITFTHIFALSMFFLTSQVYIFYSFFLFREFYFSHSFRVGLLVKTPNFPSYENDLISSQFQKNIFTRYKILDWQFFPFSTWKKCHWVQASMVSDENLAAILTVLPLKEMSHWPLAAFEIFPPFGFNFQFDYSAPWYEFLWVYLIWCSLGLLNLLVYVVLPNLGNCQPLFLEYIFSSTISPLTWDSNEMTDLKILLLLLLL